MVKKILLFGWILVCAQSVAFAGGAAVPSGITEAVKIEVKSPAADLLYEGAVYRVDYDDLVVSGLISSSVDPRKFRLFNYGNEVAISVSGEADGSFDNGDYIEFYGESIIDSRYTYTNAYWLTYSGANGKRMSSRSSGGGATPASVLGSLYYTEVAKTAYYDKTLSDPFIFPAPKTFFVNAAFAYFGSSLFSMTLKDVVNTDGSNGCKIYVKGARAADFGSVSGIYGLNISVEGNNLVAQNLTTMEDFELTYTFDGTVLNAGTQTSDIRFTAVDGGGASGWVEHYFNSVKVSYRRGYNAENGKLVFSVLTPGAYSYPVNNITRDDVVVLDVSDPEEAVVLDNHSRVGNVLTVNDLVASSADYVVATDVQITTASSNDLSIVKVDFEGLRNVNTNIDYIAVLWGDDVANNYENNMEEALSPLISRREDQDLTTKIVKTNDIYNEFNYGLASPYALKDFLIYVYNNWGTDPPDYVLLVGDASFDYRNDYDYDVYYTRLVPTFLFVNKDIINNSLVVGYVATDDWFVCLDGDDDLYPEMLVGRLPARDDDELTIMVDKTLSLEDSTNSSAWTNDLVFVSGGEQEFERTTNMMVGMVPEGYDTTRMSVTDFATTNDFNEAIRSSFDSGAIVFNYAGHGHIYLWGSTVSEGAACFFLGKNIVKAGDDIALLGNEGKYPLVLALSCINGYLTIPIGRDSLAEQFMRSQDKGAAAMFASSGISLPSYQQLMANGMYDSLFVQGDNILGSAVARSKLYLASRQGSLSSDVARSFMLFGDPALVLPLQGQTVSTPKDPGLLEEEESDEVNVFNIPQTAEQTLSELLFNNDLQDYDKASGDLAGSIMTTKGAAGLSVDGIAKDDNKALVSGGTEAGVNVTALTSVRKIDQTIAQKRAYFRRYRAKREDQRSGVEGQQGKDRGKDKEKEKDKKGFISRVFSAIGNFFKAIFNFFKRLFGF